MKKLLLLTCIALLSICTASAQWTTLSSDPAGDGASSGPLDGTKLEYRYDDVSDSVWFRITTSNFLSSNYGLNIILDVTGAGTQGTWWGNQNSTFKYNRLITAWVSTGSMGTVGITDAAGAASSNYTKIAGASKIEIILDATGKTYTLGMKRTDIFNSTSLTANVIAAAGSNTGWNDDLPNSGSGTMTLTPNTTSVNTLTNIAREFSIFPNPSNGIFTIVQNSNANSSIAVYNLTGIKVHESTINQKKNSINLSSLSAGTYLIKLTTDAITTTKQITIH